MHFFGFGSKRKSDDPTSPRGANRRASPRKTDPSKEDRLAPLLLHFDVNKTVILSDSIKMMTIEEGVREGIAEIYWGYTHKDSDGNYHWECTMTKASGTPPKVDESKLAEGKKLMTYTQYCKEAVKDKKERKEAIKTFSLVQNLEVLASMDNLCQVVVTKMQLPQDVRGSRAATESGLRGNTVIMFPSVFQLVALLQRSGRTFGILFRSFGADHKKIKEEWNAFCEMRHPVFSHLLKGIGPLDGTVAPDRRIHELHTIYRDAQGPMLLLNTFTNGGVNGPEETVWDTWAKRKPKEKTDTRGGRDFAHKVLKCQTVDGMPKLQKWMQNHLTSQATAAIKDDWAWWTWNDEDSSAGKLMSLLGGREETLQLFFDDNIELGEARIVDCRDAHGQPMDYKRTMNKYLMKVNPVEALLDDGYFIQKLTDCHGAQSSATAAMQFQQHITEVEEQKLALNAQVKVLNMQLQTLTEDIRKMKLLRKINIRDEAHLRDLLAKDSDISQFGQGQFRKVEELYADIQSGHCWMEQEDGKLMRIIEMLFLKIQFKDLILIESCEQAEGGAGKESGNILTRNYMPGVLKPIGESFFEAQDKFFENGLNCNIKTIVKDDCMPVYVPDAPNQETGITKAFPIPCKVQQSHAMYRITEKDVESRKELLSKIGLPGGKHFTTTETDIYGSTIKRFWRWDKVATWEATVSMAKGAGNQGNIASVDITQIIEKVFGGHPRREVYENLLLQMFENFTASKICGGFSGAVVIRVQPFESDGRPGEPCIVKLDLGQSIREEYINSVNVFEALPDRAARILGDAVYAFNKEGDQEFGAMKLELAGACWNVPELAQGSSTLLTTFKDLLLYESETMLLGEAASTVDDTRPFGNVHSVLAETFGQAGVVSSLRKGGKGLRRHESKPLLWGWYTLKGKMNKFNPLGDDAVKTYPPTQPMRTLYKKYFGSDIPDLKHIVIDTIKPELERLAKDAQRDNMLMPLVGLAHGDLNAANIMIDALDAVWLIDFATSVELPLFMDMAKMEMCACFEYSSIPITPEVLVAFASRDEDQWTNQNISDWLRVSPDIVTLFLRELCGLDKEALQTLQQPELERIIEDVGMKSNKKPAKQREIMRRLKARITSNQAMMDIAFAYCVKASQTLLQGDYLCDSLEIRANPLPEGPGGFGASSLAYFMEISCTIRRFMNLDVMNLNRERFDALGASGVEPVEAMSLQLWLPFLRESFRIIGYRDICPQQKMWAIYHCNICAQNVMRNIEMLKKSWKNLKGLPSYEKLQAHLNELKKGKRDKKGDTEKNADRILTVDEAEYTEADALWVYAHREIFPQLQHPDRVARKVHHQCAIYKTRPGLYCPVWRAKDEESAVHLSFNPEPNGPWQIFISEPGYVKWQMENKMKPICIGYCSPGDSGSGSPTGRRGSTSATSKDLGGRKASQISDKSSQQYGVMLKSRLIPIGPSILKTREKDVARVSAEMADHGEGFSLEEWSDGVLNDMATSGGQKRLSLGRPSHHNSERPPILRFIPIQCVAKDDAGTVKFSFTLELGSPAHCYPPGTLVCVDPNAGISNFPSASPELVIGQLTDSGHYLSYTAVLEDRPMKESRESSKDGVASGRESKPIEFDPLPLNHTFLTPIQYKKGERVMYREGLNWVDAVVTEGANEDNFWITHLRANMDGGATLKKSFTVDLQRPGHDDKKASDKGDDDAQEVERHLTIRNSGLARMSAGAFDDEVNRLKVFYKARHSAIIDALSGARLGIKECAMPTLYVATKAKNNYSSPGSVSPAPSTASSGGASVSLRSAGRSQSLIFKSGSSIGGASQEELGSGLHFDPRAGWQLLTGTLDKYENSIPVTDPNAFLVLGPPGSGKTCMIYRLMNEYLDRERNIMPLLVPISELVKRSSQDVQDSELDSDIVAAWFFKYLQITFGEESARYKAICQAIRMHRVLFLFEGLEDAGGLSTIIERCIRDIVLDRHLVVITSRPFVGGGCGSIFEDMGEHITTMKLQNLSNEQRRGIAHTRLGPEGRRAFDNFFKQISEKKGEQQGSEAGDAEEQEDVFGNPMMLSMLICYLQMRQKEMEEQRSSDQGRRRKNSMDRSASTEEDEGQGVTITSVYRVALDVMLRRVQSKQQADRHNMEEKVDVCKKILEKIAMKMHASHRNEIELSEVNDMFKANREMMKEWTALLSSVQSGHAMFLRCSTENHRTELRFLVKGFQNFFAASEIAHGGGKELPALRPLLTESWWVQMIEMLAEYSAHRYVQLIERKMEGFQADKGESFLHIAADVGHRPVFQHLKHFKESNQACLWMKNAEAQTPLHVAAKKGHAHLCSLMLEWQNIAIDAEDTSGCLPMHLAMTNGHFSCAKYLLERYTESRSDKQSKAFLKQKGQVESLATKILDKTLSEEQFLDAVNEQFTELRFFTKDDKNSKLQGVGALLSVYWICANHYEKFVRNQSIEQRLTQDNWHKLQQWVKECDINKNFVTAMLVCAAIVGLGKIKSFKANFAPGFEDATEAILYVLQTHPVVIPSFAKLETNLQQVILSSMKADFNFGQLLQAENLPGSLTVVKGILGTSNQSTVNVLGFFLFKNFVAMCGLRGPASLEGSKFMIDSIYVNFRVGIDVMGRLNDSTPQQVFNSYLKQRSIQQGLTFNENDPVSRAKVRMTCMTRVYDANGGKEVTSTYDSLQPQEAADLTRYLNIDGIVERPGFLLQGAPTYMEKVRDGAGLLCGMRMLVKIYKAAEKVYKNSPHAIVTIFMDQMVDYATKVKDKEVFEFTRFEIAKASGQKAELQANIVISPWQVVNDPKIMEDHRQVIENLVEEVCQRQCREQNFILRFSRAFPEFAYFVGDASVRDANKCTQGSLLSLYWIVSDSLEAFRRGQGVEKKLSEKSWNSLTKLAERCATDQEYFGTIMVALALRNLGKIPKFGEQLAPDVKGHKAVLSYVLDNCPKVLPSYWRLDESQKKLVRACVAPEFDFERFVIGESLPADLTSIRNLAQNSANGLEDNEAFLNSFLLFNLLVLCGSQGAESLEGSLYLTEERFLLLHSGHKVLSEFRTPGVTEQQVHTSLLQIRASACGFSYFDVNNPESRATARLACFCHNFIQSKTISSLTDAWKGLTPSERTSLVRHLTMDGIKEKPGFALRDAPEFLENAWANDEVGLLPAIRILLRVYDAAAKEFQGSQVASISIELGGLVQFAKEFFGSVAFGDMPFELKRKTAVEGVAIPKAWIPVNNPDVLGNLRTQALELSNDMLKNKVSEEQFKSRIVRIFPELSYFTAGTVGQRERTMCAMLSVYWLITGQHEAFTRSQPPDEVLSRQSWAWIQEWMDQTVKLSTAESVDAALVFMGIHALGKVPEFREELAKTFDEHYHDLALAYVLENTPQVVPSFHRLAQKHQRLIADSLSVDFQFMQFLQAENLPANLVVVKEKLKPHGDDGFAFFCFRIFAQMCGKLGTQNLKGSLFMTESEFQRFRPGLDALQQLRTLDAEAAYQFFLRFRGSQALSRFASPEHQALARLLCLGSAFDYKDGDSLCEAFDKLKPASQAALTRWLTSDGIKVRPGYVLCHVPTLLHNAKSNDSVGLKAAFDMLIRVQEMCEQTVSSSSSKVVVHFNDLATWAKEAGPDPEDFSKASISLRSESKTSSDLGGLLESRAEIKVFTVVVSRPDGGYTLSSKRRSGFYDDNPWRYRCLQFFLFVFMLSALAALSFLVLRPTMSHHYIHSLGLSPRYLRYVDRYIIHALAAIAGVCFLLLLCSCCCQRRSIPVVSVEEEKRPTDIEVGVGVGVPGVPGASEPLLSRRGYVRLESNDDGDVV